jgi:starch synthase
MSKLRILYAATEIDPFLQTTKVAELLRRLPAAMQETGAEIRIFVPRFGIINERKNRLHEVVRLSGINIAVGYFIDNEDYFHRKSALVDKNDKFHADNDERAIFFCKGVLETVKKLGWSPDIVHCNDWMTSLIPLYLKTTYKKDPVFKDAKSVFTVYNNEFLDKFEGNLVEKAKMLDIDDEMLNALKSADFSGFVKLGMQYADTVVRSDEDFSDNLNGLFKEYASRKTLSQVAADENLLSSYQALYNELAN